jgi:hypothetical protein
MKKILRFEIEVDAGYSYEEEECYRFRHDDPIVSFIVDHSTYNDNFTEKLCEIIWLSDMKDFIENKQIKILSIDEIPEPKFKIGDTVFISPPHGGDKVKGEFLGYELITKDDEGNKHYVCKIRPYYRDHDVSGLIRSEFITPYNGEN